MTESQRTQQQILLSVEEEVKSIRRLLEEVVFEAAKRGIKSSDERETR